MDKARLHIALIAIGIILLGLGVGLWQDGSHDTKWNSRTVRYEEFVNPTQTSIGLGLAVIGLGSATTGLVLLLKKRE